MNYGLATIVNANGFMAELPENSVIMLQDDFSDDELIGAIERLKTDIPVLNKIGKNAFDYIREFHSPQECAMKYMEAVEQIYLRPDKHTLIQDLANNCEIPDDESSLSSLTQSIAIAIPPKPAKRQLFVDISGLMQRDSKSDILCIAENILNKMINEPHPNGYYIEPVYASIEKGYYYAKKFTMQFMGCPSDILQDEPIIYNSGDIFFGLDSQPHIAAHYKNFYLKMLAYGVKVFFMLYDILPVSTIPQNFYPEAKVIFERWLDTISSGDGAVCISQETANSFIKWLEDNKPENLKDFKILWNYIGSDIKDSMPSEKEGDSPGNFSALSLEEIILTLTNYNKPFI